MVVSDHDIIAAGRLDPVRVGEAIEKRMGEVGVLNCVVTLNINPIRRVMDIHS